jgi:bacteriocin biosynthesis cyclodehydratase domain-containing protein
MIVLTAGAFGAKVGERLARLQSAEVVPLPHDPAQLREIVFRANFVAVASWRPYVATFELIDDLCFEARTPWSLAEVHAQRLSCGPLVRPGDGACYHCYRQRTLSHHKSPEWELALRAAYENDPDLGPRGFLGPMVEIAAQALAADAAASAADAGRMRLVDLLNGAVLESAVLGVHECRRCRPRGDAPAGERFVRALVPHLEGILE